MWRDLFGKAREPSAELDSALGDLDRLARDRPELASPAKVLSGVLAAAFASPPRLMAPYDFCAESPWYDDVLLAWGTGETAFGEYPPKFDPDDLRKRSAAITKVLKADNPAASTLARADLDWSRIADLAACGYERGIEEIALSRMLPIDLTISVARLTVLPVLAPLSAELEPHRPVDLANRARCPNCGRPPSLAETRGLEGQRFLRCGTCAAGWPVNRLGCVECGEASPRALRSMFVEGEESRLRVVACDTCGFRLKVISTLGPLSAPGLVVAELSLVHLDFP